ncbi:MAG: Fe-S cluster assembly protein SufD [Burkholderiales bacterium]|nr:Fe-S cluster assembly protein SufD [Burkholderiales bacterium]
MNSPARDYYQDEFRRNAARLPGAGLPWLRRARAEAMERFAASGFPGLRDEEWKYTSLAALERLAFPPSPVQRADCAVAAALLATLQLAPGAAHLLVFCDGRHAPALSTPGRLPDGVKLLSLAQALEQMPKMLDVLDVLEPRLTDGSGQTVFGALNTALMQDGACLYLPPGASVTQPLHLLFLTTQAAACHLRNVIVAGDGARASVIEHYAGPDGLPYFNNVVSQIYLAGGAAVCHYKLQQEGRHAFHIAGIHALQGAASRLESHSISLGAALARNDISTSFEAEGCGAILNGLYLTAGRQHVDHHTRIDHKQAGGTSREYYRGILDGISRAVFNGKVVIHAGAQKSDAHQANHNLLLSRDAEIDSKPQLEIHADDVQCTHGATVGQLDDEQLFYLRTRGIEQAMAKSLLVHAFARDVLARIKLDSLRLRLEEILSTRLPQGEAIRELA